MGCIDLKRRFGRRYKVTWEESYFAQYGLKATTDDPWYRMIPGARGHVYPWDKTRLAASTNAAGATARRLKSLPGVETWQDGSDGVTVLFPAGRVDEIADLLKLRRRRRVSDQERQRLASIGFKRTASEAHTGARFEGLDCVPRASVDVLDHPGESLASEAVIERVA